MTCSSLARGWRGRNRDLSKYFGRPVSERQPEVRHDGSRKTERCGRAGLQIGTQIPLDSRGVRFPRGRLRSDRRSGRWELTEPDSVSSRLSSFEFRLHCTAVFLHLIDDRKHRHRLCYRAYSRPVTDGRRRPEIADSQSCGTRSSHMWLWTSWRVCDVANTSYSTSVQYISKYCASFPAPSFRSYIQVHSIGYRRFSYTLHANRIYRPDYIRATCDRPLGRLRAKCTLIMYCK